MGLDFSHCNAHFSYSGFQRFRSKIYESAGFGNLSSDYYSGDVIKAKKHPIWPIINHSDCDGKLTVKKLKILIPALKEIIDSWKADSEEGEYFKEQGFMLIDGMIKASERNEPLIFC